MGIESSEVYDESIKQLKVIVVQSVMPCRLVCRYPKSVTGFTLD
jgi:hypothetical protein